MSQFRSDPISKWPIFRSYFFSKRPIFRICRFRRVNFWNESFSMCPIFEMIDFQINHFVKILMANFRSDPISKWPIFRSDQFFRRDSLNLFQKDSFSKWRIFEVTFQSDSFSKWPFKIIFIHFRGKVFFRPDGFPQLAQGAAVIAIFLAISLGVFLIGKFYHDFSAARPTRSMYWT